MRSSLLALSLVVWAHGYDEKCSTLVTFEANCLIATDDGFEDMCNDFTTLQSDWCVEEGEYIIFYLDQARLAECKALDGPLLDDQYDNVERFKYQCLADFNGPCKLLAEFEEECIEPLGSLADIEEEDFCSLTPADPDSPGVPSDCFLQAHHLFNLDQQYSSGCSDELADYFSVERFKFQCAAYDSTCSNLENFIERCVPHQYNANYQAVCEVYVFDADQATEYFVDDQSLDFCLQYAEEYLLMSEYQIHTCDPEVSDADLGSFYQLRDHCEPLFDKMPTPSPTATPAPSASVGGPCGYLQAFEDECLSDLTLDSEFASMCEALVWGVGVEDDGLEYCARLSPTVLNLPDPNFDSCSAPRMDENAYLMLQKLRSECGSYTPMPTATPAPTYPEYGGPCEFLDDFVEDGCVNEGDMASDCANFERITDLGSVDDDSLSDCILKAQTVLNLPEDNFQYCGRDARMRISSFNTLDALRGTCDPDPFPQPTPSPPVPAPSPAPSSSSPGGGSSEATPAPTTWGNGSGALESSSAASSTIILAVLLPVALLALMGAVWCSRSGSGGSNKGVAQESDVVEWRGQLSDFDDEDEGDDAELEQNSARWGKRFAEEHGERETEMGSLGPSRGGSTRDVSVDRPAPSASGGRAPSSQFASVPALAPPPSGPVRGPSGGDLLLQPPSPPSASTPGHTEFDSFTPSTTVTAPASTGDFDAFVSSANPSSAAGNMEDVI